ncbi:MAG: hypothetical protein Q9211_006447, partial [Gyalolechia sp. 1 TL-2023]
MASANTYPPYPMTTSKQLSSYFLPSCLLPIRATNYPPEAFFTSQTLYKLTINATKISFLFLYLRIFPSNQENRRFRIATHVVMAYILLYAIASIGATIFQCTPVARYFDHSIDGTCINVELFWYFNAINNILGDILTLSLPVRKIYQLQLPRSEKMGLYTVFGLGI